MPSIVAAASMHASIRAESTRFLIDCSTSSEVALKRAEIERNPIDTIFITHFHSDHFGGIPYFVLDAQLLAKRTAPLAIVGLEGIETWYEHVMETAFPGSAAARRAFEITLIAAECLAACRCGQE
jgi:ribonuclease BN (tRNA processing enzyme)